MKDAARDGGWPGGADRLPGGAPDLPVRLRSRATCRSQYYPQLRDNPARMRDYSAARDRPATRARCRGGRSSRRIGYQTEHPGLGTTISAGVTFVKKWSTRWRARRTRSDTLVLLTYDEGGGFFDHVAPPPTSTVDDQPYGTRVPLIAIGPFAREERRLARDAWSTRRS